MATRILQPGEIETQPKTEIPFLRLPQPHEVFAQRAARLRQLANGHKLGDYLNFAAQLADAQQAALNAYPQVRLPDEAYVAQCKAHRVPVLGAQAWQRDPQWRVALRQIAAAAQAKTGGAARDVLRQIAAASDELIEAQATKLLVGALDGADRALAPIVAVGLQTYWTHMNTTLGPAAFGSIDSAIVCPVCGTHPVASIVRIGDAGHSVRYLSCALCAAEWHMVRIKCSNCESTKGIEYLGVEGASNAIKAETCGECKSYLKIFYMEKDPYVEPAADDLASLALDLLLDETGYARSGLNFMLLPGDAIPSPSTGG
jgi:FdhE protein